MFSVKGISEIVLAVKDVGQAAAFYQEVVGLKVDNQPEKNFLWLWAGAPGRLGCRAVVRDPATVQLPLSVPSESRGTSSLQSPSRTTRPAARGNFSRALSVEKWWKAARG